MRGKRGKRSILFGLSKNWSQMQPANNNYWVKDNNKLVRVVAENAHVLILSHITLSRLV
jgi:hypothetical protein